MQGTLNFQGSICFSPLQGVLAFFEEHILSTFRHLFSTLKWICLKMYHRPFLKADLKFRLIEKNYENHMFGARAIWDLVQPFWFLIFHLTHFINIWRHFVNTCDTFDQHLDPFYQHLDTFCQHLDTFLSTFRHILSTCRTHLINI